MSSTADDSSLRVMTGGVSNQSSSSLNKLIRGSEGANKPIGVSIFGSCFKFSTQQSKQNFHKGLMLLLTFIAYAAFHMGRRPFSIVKNVLNRDCSKFYNQTRNTANTANTAVPIELDLQHTDYPEVNPTYAPFTKDTSCDWAPFNDDATANQLLAYLDTAFLASYAICMFGSGVVAERTNLRYLITASSILSGLALIAFGVSYQLDIHSMLYFIIVQIFAGATQSTGWPVVVTCVGNWLDDSSRGTIYGIWNSHTNLGNILGATIAGYFVESDWGLSFIVPGGIMIAVGLLLFLFLVPSPKDVNLARPTEHSSVESREVLTIVTACQKQTELNSDLENNKIATISSSSSQETLKAVSFMTALKIPGVIEYSFCLFFSKLVSYTFLYWLPRYIASSTTFNSEDSAYLSTPFDVGGIAGAILAGYLSDRFKVNGIICNIMLLVAIPSMFMYQTFGAYSSLHNICLQLIVGLLVNGPYCLITTSVSADLGHRIKDGHAMATVSAIIDGMGSLGAVVGPLFAGLVQSGDWRAVFWMLMMSDVLAALCIARITIQDIKSVFRRTTPAAGN
jgi:OPA family glycerol-3-phosphate transporter-like MFS transporter 1/2